ncbi:MAG: Zn-dependent oligopeptidase [Planctomycetes bacterium]|nr:Zn-dependent oligopeptidase [Planctomycetota bacterium]
MRSLLLLLALILFPSCATHVPQPKPQMEAFQIAAQSFQARLDMPIFERTPGEVEATVASVLATADAALDRLAGQDGRVVSFASSIAKLDDISYPVTTVLNRIYLMKETQPTAEMRDACTQAVNRLNEWGVQVAYREDVYLMCQAFLDRYTRGEVPKLEGEDQRLMLEVMRDYRRDGMTLEVATRTEVAALKNKLNKLESDFDTNITNAQVELYYSAEELEGLTDSFLQATRQSDGTHRVRVTVSSEYLSVMQNAVREETRKRCNRARYSVVQHENGPILENIVATRQQIAQLLGYANWADYKIEPKMAKDGATAMGFVTDLVQGLEPKFQQEVEILRKLKVEHTGDPEAQINFWDFRFYQTQYMKSGFGVDPEALRVYFPLKQVLAGMFDAYEHIFNLEFTPIRPDYKWVDDLELYVVSDSTSGEPLGMFYLDNFPREGKYNHFAQFDIIGGKRLADGNYQRPVVALVCNFTPGVSDAPALMSHNEVETIFHEFGHAMHSILTRVKFGRYAGANVARDFVEAPSQMFENWAWDPTVLKNFAADYRDPSKKIPVELLQKMKEADLATKGIYYRRQLALGLSDLRMHTELDCDPKKAANDATNEVLFPVQEGTHFAAYWGHLTGYDAGYYGYAWADAIAADMATVFQKAPKRYRDQEVGMRLRRQIYEVGGAVDPAVAVSRFLQREPDNKAFLQTLGIQ